MYYARSYSIWECEVLEIHVNNYCIRKAVANIKPKIYFRCLYINRNWDFGQRIFLCQSSNYGRLLSQGWQIAVNQFIQCWICEQLWTLVLNAILFYMNLLSSNEGTNIANGKLSAKIAFCQKHSCAIIRIRPVKNVML